MEDDVKTIVTENKIIRDDDGVTKAMYSDKEYRTPVWYLGRVVRQCNFSFINKKYSKHFEQLKAHTNTLFLPSMVLAVSQCNKLKSKSNCGDLQFNLTINGP